MNKLALPFKIKAKKHYTKESRWGITNHNYISTEQHKQLVMTREQ